LLLFSGDLFSQVLHLQKILGSLNGITEFFVVILVIYFHFIEDCITPFGLKNQESGGVK
jgi:hypothetical protein